MDNEQQPESKRASDALLDVSAIGANLLPYIGGALSTVLSGISGERKLDRMRQLLVGLAQDLGTFKSEAAEKYCKTDEFAELFEKTMRQASEERSEQKRLLLRGFLLESIRVPCRNYDERVRLLKLIGDVQPDHILIIKAVAQEPDPNPPGWAGSIGDTLARRIPGMTRDRIVAQLSELRDLRILTLADPNMMMTPHGAEDLRRGLTVLGRDLMELISR
jgi:hypothetical protein